MRESRVHYLQAHPGLPIPEIKIAEPFRIVVVAEIEVDNQWRDKTACALIDRGCQLALCWGLDCALWDRDIRYASIYFGKRNRSNVEHYLEIITCIDESLSEAFFRAEMAFDEYLPLDDVLILHVSNHDAESFVRSKYEASKTLE